MLAVAEHRSPGIRRHQVRVALIAMALANAWNYKDARLLASMLEASLFHDIGELYIAPFSVSPDSFAPTREWVSYAAHPIIGAALVREVAGLAGATQSAILEHHERLDGFGYPRGLRQKDISAGGQILGLADMIGALMRKSFPRLRIEIALKIVPGEQDPTLLNILSSLLADCPPAAVEEAPADAVTDEIHQVFSRIHAVQEILSQWQEKEFSPAARAIIKESFERFISIQKAFASTGIDGLESLLPALSGPDLNDARLEARCVLDEIFWRLTRISRELALRCTKLPAHEAEELMHMADALVGQPCSGPTMAAA